MNQGVSHLLYKTPLKRKGNKSTFKWPENKTDNKNNAATVNFIDEVHSRISIIKAFTTALTTVLASFDVGDCSYWFLTVMCNAYDSIQIPSVEIASERIYVKIRIVYRIVYNSSTHR